MAVLAYRDLVTALAELLEGGDTPVATRAFLVPRGFADTGEAVIGYPTEVEFDVTMGRGSDRVLLPIWVCAGIVGEDDTLDRIDTLCGMGDGSIRGAIEPAIETDAGRQFAVRVIGMETDRMLSSGGIDYAAPRFDVEVLT